MVQSMQSVRVRRDLTTEQQQEFYTSCRIFFFFFCFVKHALEFWKRLHVWRRQWHSNPVLLPRKPHGWRSLVGCNAWDREESDMTERLHFHFSLSCTGEGNGNPLQCSCLESPRDGTACWAAVYGVLQSRTRLKRLSSSSSSSISEYVDSCG